jgi:hypothetical protein
MFAYIVGEEGAKKLISQTNLLEYPLDDVVLQKGGLEIGKLKAYVAKKKFCSVSFSDSEITKMGRPF